MSFAMNRARKIALAVGIGIAGVCVAGGKDGAVPAAGAVVPFGDTAK